MPNSKKFEMQQQSKINIELQTPWSTNSESELIFQS